MQKNPARARRLLLQVVGASAALAAAACGGATTKTEVGTPAFEGGVGSPVAPGGPDAHVVMTGTSVEEGGALGTVEAIEAGPPTGLEPEEAGPVGDLAEDAGEMGKVAEDGGHGVGDSIDAAGTHDVDAGS